MMTTNLSAIVHDKKGDRIMKSRYIVRITEEYEDLPTRIVYADSLRQAKKCCKIIYKYRKMIYRPFIDVYVYDTKEYCIQYRKLWRN